MIPFTEKVPNPQKVDQGLPEAGEQSRLGQDRVRVQIFQSDKNVLKWNMLMGGTTR